MTTRTRLAHMVASRASYHSDPSIINAIAEEIAYKLGGDYKRVYDSMTDRSFRLFVTSVRKFQHFNKDEVNGRNRRLG